MGGYLSVEDSSPDLGSIIEINRRQYHHVGIYVGEGFIIHANAEGIDCNSTKIEKRLLSEVAGTSKVRIKNPDVFADIMFQKRPRPKEEILKSAEQNVGKTLDYNIMRRNCEHYACEWRYGQAFSVQVGALALNSSSLEDTTSLIARKLGGMG